MCGFVGYLRTSTEPIPRLDAVLQAMSNLLVHRGPDDSGIWRNERCGLAHRRLSILDRTPAGRQPMVAGPIHLVTNAEFYNHKELAKQHSLNDELQSRTDTEVILKLIERHGVSKTAMEIDGMYAFAVWDEKAEVLHLVRDPFGVKPLFVLQQPDLIWFASEIKPLLLAPGFQRKPSLEALHHYLSFDYIPGSHTAFDGIEEVRPGTHWQVDANTGQINKHPFFSTQWNADTSMNRESATEESRRLLKAAVERQLQADVEVGVMLSGGLDSSSIAALTKSVKGDGDFHTFSIGFDDTSFNESHHADVVAQHLGTKHHHIAVDDKAVAELLPRYLTSIDEPYADGSAIPTALLAKYARDHVTVLLSGEGGDEMFSGYDTHAAAVARRWYRFVPTWARRGIIAPLVHSLPVRHNKLSFDFRAKRFVQGVEYNTPTSHYAWREVLSEDAKQQLLMNNERFAKFEPSASLFVDAWNQCDSTDELCRLLHIDRTHHLPDDLMVKNDRMTMAFSIEARVPFCDKALVDFMATVPAKLLMEGMNPKAILRNAMKDLLPKPIIQRKKMGLEMPYSAWIRGPWREWIRDLLSAEQVRATTLFRPEEVHRMLQEHEEMRVDHGRALWGIINFILWHRLYIQTDDFLDTSLSSPVQ